MIRKTDFKLSLRLIMISIRHFKRKQQLMSPIQERQM